MLYHLTDLTLRPDIIADLVGLFMGQSAEAGLELPAAL